MTTNSGLTPGGASYPLLTDAPHPDNIKEPVVELDQRAPVIAADVAALNSILDEEDRTDRLGWLTNTNELVGWDGDDWLVIGSAQVRAHATAGLNAPSATSFADLPTNPLSVSVTVAVATRVKIELRSVNFGTTTGSILAGIALSGATTSAADSPDDSVIMYATTAGRGNSAVKIITLQPGTTTIKAQAYQVGGGTNTMNYSQLIVSEF